MSTRSQAAVAIVGLGVTEQGRGLGANELELRRRALELALADAGVERCAVDGYVFAASNREDLRYLGLAPNFSWPVQSGGATAPSTVGIAAGAIVSGQAELVACAYGMAPTSATSAEDGRYTLGAYGYGYPARLGMIGAASAHALHARWHMDHYGTTSLHLGAVAVALRNHAIKRPDAITYGQPITLDDHQASPMIVDPFRLLDCCRDTDGGVVLLLASAERAKQQFANKKPIYVRGMGFGHNIANWHARDVYAHHDNIAPAKARAFAQAGVALSDIDVAQFYDPFTISIIMQLEHYGFCKPGQGGPFVADGAIALDGAIPANTGGGQISGFYAAGFTPIVEALRQLRGEAGATQIADAELALASGHGLNGGIQNTWSHGTLVLGVEP